MKRVLTHNNVLSQMWRSLFVSKIGKITGFIGIQKNVFFKSMLLFFVFFSAIISVQAQTFSDDLTLSSQAEVDAFDYTEIVGDLIISGTDIEDLSPLSMLTTVDGLHIISNTLLPNLNGLQNINSVGGNLILKDNSALSDLTGLENVTTIMGYLKILNNDALISLDKLQNINSIQGSLEVYGNALITDLAGLQNITSAGGYLKIRSNGALVSLDKLQNIKWIGGSLEIYNNDLLKNLEGLENVESVNGYLKIESNDAILDLKGLRNISSINGYLKVLKNKMLTSLDGLQKVTFVDGDLELFDNLELQSFCALYPLINAGGLSGTYTVSGNAINPTEQQIIENGSCSLEISSPIVSVGDPFSNGCDSWKIPVTVGSFKSVGAISLKLSFNESHLNYSGVDLNPAISSAFTSGANGTFTLGYFGDVITLPDSTVLFTLNYKVVPSIDGTPFYFSWSDVPGECEFAGADGGIVYYGIFNNLEITQITDELPEITCPGDINVENDEGICGAVVTYLAPVGTDNCPDMETEQIAGLPSSTKFPVGNTINTFQVTDSQGNIAQCSFHVTVVDTEAPVIADCPENITIYTNETGTCEQIVTWTQPTATDNCGLLSLTSDFEPGAMFQLGTTNVTYTATDIATSANTATCSFEITVIDNSPPTFSNCAMEQSAIVTDGCSVKMPDFETDDIIVADNCGQVTISQSPLKGEWMCFEDTSHEVVLTATDKAGNVATCLTNFTVKKATINGTLTYNNAFHTPLNNVTITLAPGEQTCITDDEGKYVFNNLCAQTYTLNVTNNEKSVGYINSTDASAVNKWGTTGGSIEYVCFLAGDVTNDLFINSTDALKIQHNFVHGTGFDRSNWSYWEKGSTILNNTDPYLKHCDHPNFMKVDVSGFNISNLELYALCTGDFNGSFSPLKSNGTSLYFVNKNNFKIGENCEFEFPIYSENSMEIGAVSLIFELPSQFVEVVDVKIINSEVPVSWVFKENELRIGWNSIKPVSVTTNENLISLKLKTTNNFKSGQSFDLNLINNPLNELADGNSEVIDGATLFASHIYYGLTGRHDEITPDVLLFRNYPNPFHNSTTLEYTLPFDGKVNIDIYNQLGQLVLHLVDANKLAGKYSVTDCGKGLKSGIYIANLQLSNNKTNISRKIRLELIR